MTVQLASSHMRGVRPAGGGRGMCGAQQRGSAPVGPLSTTEPEPGLPRLWPRGGGAHPRRSSPAGGRGATLTGHLSRDEQIVGVAVGKAVGQLIGGQALGVEHAAAHVWERGGHGTRRQPQRGQRWGGARPAPCPPRLRRRPPRLPTWRCPTCRWCGTGWNRGSPPHRGRRARSCSGVGTRGWAGQSPPCPCTLRPGG